MRELLEFKPDWGIPPFETFREYYECLGWNASASYFCIQLGMTRQEYEAFKDGELAITESLATDFLTPITGIPVSTWLNLEANWQSYKASVRQLS
jgi:plasmid maintenance system antidote protein VapI